MATQKLASVKPPAKGAKGAKGGAESTEEEAPPPPPAKPAGKKRLFALLGLMVLVLGFAGAYAAGLLAPLEQKLAGEPADPQAAAKAAPAKAAKTAQVFVPLDNFTVNLQDNDRYLQL